MYERHKAKTGAKANWFKAKKRDKGDGEEDGEGETEKACGGGGHNHGRGSEVQPRQPKWTEQKGDERKVEGVIFIPFTMGSALRSKLQNEDDRLTRVMRMPRIRYVENPGRALADTLVEKDPWYRLGGGCSRAFCPIYYWAKGKGIRCTKEGVCYKLECLQCRQLEPPILIIYIGETSRSGRERVLEHLAIRHA